jgi:hypothetical protein
MVKQKVKLRYGNFRFCSGIVNNFSLLGCCPASIGNFVTDISGCPRCPREVNLKSTISNYPLTIIPAYLQAFRVINLNKIFLG